MNNSNWNIPIYSPVNGFICHYTSNEGFYGIIANKKITLWFTRYDHFDDRTEGIHINNLYIEVCDKLYSSNKISGQFYNLIKEIKLDYNKTNFYYDSSKECLCSLYYSKTIPFICCFSRDIDSQLMWENYLKGSSSGYNIVFASEKMYKSIKNKGYIIDNFNVIYDNNIKMTIIESLIMYTYINFKNIGKIENYIKHQINKMSLIFKNTNYQYEHETRLIIYIPENDIKEAVEIKHRKNNNLSIPYIEVDINANSICEINIAPLSCSDDSKEIQKQTIFDYLKKEIDIHINHINIDFSNIPDKILK